MYPFNSNTNKRNLQTLVENRTIFQSEKSELNLFETFEVAQQVNLEFEYPVIVSMLRGKKVMHLNDKPEFDFYPGQSLVMPVLEPMVIDFPEATMETPTRCLALGVDPNIIREITAQHAELIAIENDPRIKLAIDADPSRLSESTEIQLLMQRLLLTFTKEAQSRDLLINLMLKELVVRLLQSEGRHALLKASSDVKNNNRIAFAVDYIKEHLTEKIQIEDLSKKVCMSASNFHKVFKNSLGVSPAKFIINERVKHAKKLLGHTSMSISEVAHNSGFNDTAYFSRQFKKVTGMTPKAYIKSSAIHLLK